MADEPRRPNPERLLKQLEQQERRQRRGILKVFLGYASGVGKSFQMLDEGRRRRERGEDVVIAAVQPKCSLEVQQLLSKAEVMPPVQIEGQEAIDVAAIVRRRPQVVIIDGLAYDNPPGTRHAKRWQDVEELLEAGISVIASINLQYIEEFREEVARITGKPLRQSVPKSFLEAADEIVIVDSPADAGILRGGTLQPEAGSLTTGEQKLARLREMALLVAAEVVDRQLESYLTAHGLELSWGTQERIAVCVTPRSNALHMIASGRRNADRFHGELYVIYVKQPALSHEDQGVLGKNLAYAIELGARVEVLEGLDPVNAIIRFARERGITQIFIGHALREGGWRRLWSDLVNRLIWATEGIDISIFPH
jgi:two-component system sensor histidine kinase KdpD